MPMDSNEWRIWYESIYLGHKRGTLEGVDAVQEAASKLGETLLTDEQQELLGEIYAGLMWIKNSIPEVEIKYWNV